MNPFKCKECKDNFDTDDLLKDHMQTAHNDKDEIFTCTMCSKKFNSKGKYMDHLKDHTNIAIRHKCCLCPCYFKKLGHLNNHLDKVHGTKKKIFHCKTCSKNFESKEILNSHIKEHPRELKCSFCDRVYTCKNSLRNHVRINHEDFKRSLCPYCPCDFKWPHHLKGHIKKVHIEKGHAPTDLLKKGLFSFRRKTNDCVVCSDKFPKKLDLMLHLKKDHNQELDIFTCCICPAVFSLRNSLIIHLEDHMRKKSFFNHSCEQCYPEPDPIPFVIDDEAENIVTDNRTEIEKEIIDFEITLMEDEQIRRLIKYRVMHERRKQIHENRKKRLLLKYQDSESEDGAEFIGLSKDNDGSVNDKDAVTCVCDVCNNGNCSCNQMVVIPDENHENNFLDNDIDRDVKICPFDFDEDSNYFLHKCEMCKATFSLNSSLDEHMKFSHGISKPEEENNISEKTIEEESSESARNPSPSQKKQIKANGKGKKRKDNVKNKVYLCHICSRKFKEPINLGRHIKLDHAKSKKEKRNYECKICKAKFFYSAQYANHMRFNHKEKVRKGDKRQILLSPQRRKALKKIQSTAVSNGTEKCGKCDVFFSTKLELLRHISDVHMGLKPTNLGVYWCYKCNVEFTSKKQIEAHYKTNCS